MAIWRYIGCNTKELPSEFKTQKLLDINMLKELMGSVPIVEGKLEAVNEEAVVSLLMHDDIYPLRLHKLTEEEIKIERLKSLIAKHKSHKIS